MAESLKTILMSALTSKATPAESDTLIVGEGNELKKISFSQLFTYLKDKLGINTLNTKFTKIKVISQKVTNISIAANGSIDVKFDAFPEKSGAERTPLNINFNNSANGGTNYSGITWYNTYAESDSLHVCLHNFYTKPAKIDATLTIMYVPTEWHS